MTFWSDKRVLVTGGTGFLGTALRRALDTRGPAEVIAPSSREYDLTRQEDAARMYADARPDVVVHLAARVAGIGGNMARPADLYVDNLLMGTYVLEEARKASVPKAVLVGTI